MGDPVKDGRLWRWIAVAVMSHIAAPLEDLYLMGVDRDGGQPIPTIQGLREATPWTVDSGASESVADPKHMPEATVEPSPGSLAGQSYVGPNPKERLPNLGQMRARRMLSSGMKGAIKFQAANFRKPLMAVSGSVDQGNPVWFDQETRGGACIIPGDAPELEEIRRLIAQVNRRIKLERQGGIWILRNWFLDERSAPGFARPGTKA